MENEGFERSLSFLEERGVVVQSLVTDRHTGAQKSMREQRKDIGIVGTGKVDVLQLEIALESVFNLNYNDFSHCK